MAFIFKEPRFAPPDNSRCGVLLLNLGTPDDTGYFPVRRYLREFLSDRRVIESPPWLWQPILQSVILSRRPFASGRNYARIWDRTENASPLRVFTRRQAEKLGARLADEDIPVAWGMRYGKPSVAEALEHLMDRGCDRIVSLPLYPQYSASTTATANDQLFRALMRLRRQPAVLTVPSFPDHPLFIGALANSVRVALDGLDFAPQKLVVSFHGLPKSMVEKGDPYAAECRRTITALRAVLGYDEERMPLTFQSRFGPMEWLQPYTAPFVSALPAQGVRRIAVLTPGFLSDCIETLDEIGNELRHAFKAAGGEDFALIPCLNDSEAAIDLLEALSRQALRGFVPSDS